MLSSEVIPYKLFNLYYGNFGFTVDGTYPIYYCREDFEKAWRVFPKDTIIIHFKPYNVNALCEILNQLEIKIQLEPSKIGKTTSSCCYWIKPNIFWRRSRLKRSLLTAIIKSIWLDKNISTIDQLFNSEYLINTKPALIRFFDGNTRITTYSHHWQAGWISVFSNIPDDQLKNYLVKSC